ncbi:DUF3800 domain-containing protein [Chloroflexota bacterium]
MDLIFVDDAGQLNPSRDGMGKLIAIGGIHISDEYVQALESEIENICIEYKFPPNELFKWSPRRGLWMHDNLIEDARQSFFFRIFESLKTYMATAIVVIEDKNFRRATSAESHELDVIQLFFERAHFSLTSKQHNGIIIASQPSGGRTDEYKFLADCLDSLRTGTDYVKPDRIVLNVISTAPRFIRLLQVADVVTSCVLSFVSGEIQYSPPCFNCIKPILASHQGRIGGFGLKIHPDFRYMNLYHWLLNDSQLNREGEIFLLPQRNFPYKESPNKP